MSNVGPWERESFSNAIKNGMSEGFDETTTYVCIVIGPSSQRVIKLINVRVNGRMLAKGAIDA